MVGTRTAEALASLRRKGRVYGPLPFGFDRHGDLLIENHQEMRVLVQILDMRNTGVSYQAIADWLNSEQIPAKRGGLWNPPQVRSVVRTAQIREEQTGS